MFQQQSAQTDPLQALIAAGYVGKGYDATRPGSYSGGIPQQSLATLLPKMKQLYADEGAYNDYAKTNPFGTNPASAAPQLLQSDAYKKQSGEYNDIEKIIQSFGAGNSNRGFHGFAGVPGEVGNTGALGSLHTPNPKAGQNPGGALGAFGQGLATSIHNNPWIVALPMATAMAAPAIAGAVGGSGAAAGSTAGGSALTAGDNAFLGAAHAAGGAGASSASGGLFSSIGNAVNTVRNIPTSLATAMGVPSSVAPYVGSGVVGGAINYAKTGDLGSALKAGAFTGAGSYAGNSLLGSGSIPGLNLGSAIGGFAGNSLASSLAGSPKQNVSPSNNTNSSMLAAPFHPTQQGAQDLPASLHALGGLTSDQQASNVATQGVYGGGNGPQENSYFLNLMNRQLVDSSGKVGDMSGVSPIENSYLQKLGLGGAKNSTGLLQAISNWKP